MQQPIHAIPVLPSSELLPAGTMIDDRSVRQAGLVAGVVGLLGLLLLCCLFVDGDYMATMLNHNHIIGFPLMLVLLLVTGGYGLLAFYGFRLRYLWIRRNQPSVHVVRHDPGRLALSDLRKIRFFSAATMLAVLLAYLIPPESPTYRSSSRGGLATPWWDTTQASLWAIMGWTMVASLVIVAARRAAWEIAAAAGNLSGPDDVRAFEVLTPGTSLQHPSLPAVEAANHESTTERTPMPAMSLGVADYQVQIGAVTPVIANLPLASALSATDRIAAAESINTRRDWEAVLMTMLVLLLLLAISLVDAGRGLRATFLKPGTALEVYEEHKSGVARLTPFSSVNSPPPTAPANDSTRGVIAASAFLCEQLVTALSIAGILWVALCMMTGPRWRRPAIVLLWFFCGAVLVSTFAFGYLADVEQIWLASRGIFLGPARNYGHVPGSLARQLELAILPALLIVALTRPSMRTLFEQRVRKLRKRSA